MAGKSTKIRLKGSRAWSPRPQIAPKTSRSGGEWTVRSNGSAYPERLKIRAPSYVNVPTFRATCIGGTVADATIALAAVDPCYSCTERMAAVRDAESGRRLTGFSGMVQKSREATEALCRKELGISLSDYNDRLMRRLNR